MIDSLLEKDLLPDWMIRAGIRKLLKQRIKGETSAGGENPDRHLLNYAEDLGRRPIAENTAAANEQHYEVPTAFYQKSLGPRLKYSGCLYPTGQETLREAEEAMLALYVERGQLAPETKAPPETMTIDEPVRAQAGRETAENNTAKIAAAEPLQAAVAAPRQTIAEPPAKEPQAELELATNSDRRSGRQSGPALRIPVPLPNPGYEDTLDALIQRVDALKGSK